ncbi:MAG: hypothetical protein HOC71_17710 [Candidatus Latescibacteria bacterium]|nr:hypothetical protein [Candidatus Latescibacterota bacterium]
MKIPFQKKWYVNCGLLICLFSVVCSGCLDKDDSAETDEQVYATVNGTKLTESELQALVPREFYGKMTPSHKKEIVTEWVNNELLYQRALELGIDEEPEIARILKKSRLDLLSTELLERTLSDIEIPDDETLKKYYEESKDYFILHSTEYRIRYALFDNRNEANEFYDKIKRGASFSELAKQDSKDPSAKSGGELGIVNEESVEPTIWESIANTYKRLGLRKISDVFSVIDGFAIVIVDEIHEMGSVRPFDTARNQVIDLYMNEKREEVKKSLLESLTRKSVIEYNF